jgi:drug/metabolite transporter (DMT)-like permease
MIEGDMTDGIALNGSTTSKGGSIYIILAALLWSTSGLLIKYIPWHPMAIASGRSLTAAVVFCLYYRHRIWHRINRLTWISGLSLVLTQSLYVVANKLTTATNAIMLQYVSPAFIIILGVIFLHIRPTKREVLAVIWAFAGIFLFFFDDLSVGNQLGNAMALFTGLTFAIVYVVINRPECQPEIALLIGQIGTMLAGLPFLVQVKNILSVHILVILFLGIFQLGLSFILFNRGIRRIPPLNASLLAMIEPIMNPIWVFIFLGEKPGPMALLGALIVISASLFLNLDKLKYDRIRMTKHI